MRNFFAKNLLGFSKLDFVKKTHFNWLWYQKNWENLSEKVFLFCLARNKCLQIWIFWGGEFFECEIVIRLSNYCTRIFSIWGLFGVKEISRKKVTRLCKKYAYQVHYWEKVRKLGGEDFFTDIRPTWLIFFLFVEKCTNETLCWRASQWIFCVWFFCIKR